MSVASSSLGDKCLLLHFLRDHMALRGRIQASPNKGGGARKTKFPTSDCKIIDPSGQIPTICGP